jgi:hypothetical protein
MVVRITNNPQHGSAQASTISSYLREEHPNCGKEKVKGIALNYMAESKYTGDDALDIIVFYPDGWAKEITRFRSPPPTELVLDEGEPS